MKNLNFSWSLSTHLHLLSKNFEFMYYVNYCLVSSQTLVQLSIRTAGLIVAGQGFQKTNVSRWDVVLTVQLPVHATVSTKLVMFCFQRSLGCVYRQNFR